MSAATRREHRGVNVLMLWASAEITGSQDGRLGEKGTPVVFNEELARRGGDAAAGGMISGPFEEAAAEATQGRTCLLAKTSYVFNAAPLEGATPPQRPELPGLAVRLKSAERFVAALEAVLVNGGDPTCYRPRRTGSSCRRRCSGDGQRTWPPEKPCCVG